MKRFAMMAGSFLAVLMALAVDTAYGQSATSPRCVASASAPSYAEGQFAPCSQDLSGNQRMAGTVTAAAAPAVPSTNGAGTITTGGTFQQLAASSTSRKSVDFQNKSGNGDVCYLYFGTTVSATTAKSIQLKDGQEYLRSSGQIPSDAVQATCASNGDAFYFTTQ